MSGTKGQVLEFELGEETYCVSIDYVTGSSTSAT